MKNCAMRSKTCGSRAWPIKGIEPNRQTFEINGSTFHCHGYIPSLDAWVMLGSILGKTPDQPPNAKLGSCGVGSKAHTVSSFLS
jgi:hypothetical protein